MKQLPLLVFSVFLVFILSYAASPAGAQSRMAAVRPPDRKHLFNEDTKAVRRKKSQRVQKVLKADTGRAGNLDFKAADVQFDKEKNVVSGKGGVLVSKGGLQIQADRGSVNLDSNEADVEGRVLLSHPGGEISADSGTLNVDDATGTFKNVNFSVEEGQYGIQSEEAAKLSDTRYRLGETSFSTCHCEDSSSPWSIGCSSADITKEGYAFTRGTTLKAGGVPFFYAPWFAFPVKQERASGLLATRQSYSNKDGIGIKLPLYAVLDDSSDLTVTPFTETKTRTGGSFDYRETFSRRSSLSGRFLYSDESQRDGDLRGTQVGDLYDPTFDEQRFGGFFKQRWRNAPNASVPLSLVSDVHYVSDDLFLREMEDDRIGLHDAQYATSRILASASLTEDILAEFSTEYNQSILTNDDLVFQRLPELSLGTSRTFRPFGYNPYGLKLVSSLAANATEFDRRTGYDGMRSNVSPTLRLPFHYGNYFNSALTGTFHQTFYQLNDTGVPGRDRELDASQSRSLSRFSASLGTALERVYDLDDDNSLSWMTSLGADNQANRLARVKHVIEPTFSYTYLPKEDQSSLPFFDSFDRLSEKSVLVYGARTSLVGRFLPGRTGSSSINELTPRLEDLPVAGFGTGLPEFGSSGFDNSAYRPMKRGEAREVAYLGMRQAYDFVKARDESADALSPWSDVNTSLGLNPTRNLNFQIENNYTAQQHDVSSWAISSQFYDDRGDALRARFTYFENNISQVEGNAEMALSERLRLGYYSRFDDRESEFIESRVALRIASACDCWYFDLGVSDRINPDRQMVFATVTLAGLGDFTQSMGMGGQ